MGQILGQVLIQIVTVSYLFGRLVLQRVEDLLLQNGDVLKKGNYYKVGHFNLIL